MKQIEVVDISFIDGNIYFRVLCHIVKKFYVDNHKNSGILADDLLNSDCSTFQELYHELQKFIENVRKDLDELETNYNEIEQFFVLKRDGIVNLSADDKTHKKDNQKLKDSSKVEKVIKALISYFEIVESEICFDIREICQTQDIIAFDRKYKNIIEGKITELLDSRNCLAILKQSESDPGKFIKIVDNSILFSSLRLSDVFQNLKLARTKLQKSQKSVDPKQLAFYAETFDFWKATIKSSKDARMFLNIWILQEILKGDTKSLENKKKKK